MERGDQVPGPTDQVLAPPDQCKDKPTGLATDHLSHLRRLEPAASSKRPVGSAVSVMNTPSYNATCKNREPSP